MATIRGAEAVFKLVGVLAADAAALAASKEVLEREFGPAAAEMPAIRFAFTSYYERELGPSPLRAFFGYGAPFPPGELADLKVLTNALESELAKRVGGPWPRPVNLDPGYIAPDKLVLASAKNFSHRIFLSEGVYAEVTLQFVKGRFVPLPWTFPDYASGAYFPFFMELRGMLMRSRATAAPPCARTSRFPPPPG